MHFLMLCTNSTTPPLTYYLLLLIFSPRTFGMFIAYSLSKMYSVLSCETCCRFEIFVRLKFLLPAYHLSRMFRPNLYVHSLFCSDVCSDVFSQFHFGEYKKIIHIYVYFILEMKSINFMIVWQNSI